jgi:hypothetical protein
LLLLHRKPELLPCHFSYPLEIGYLKLHTVGDVNLSRSLGDSFVSVQEWTWLKSPRLGNP